MMSMLSQVFFCCLRSRTHDKLHPDETTPLIRPTDEVSPYPGHEDVIVDYQKTKERLGVIVRSKEGKMVNVLSAVPFNLRNEPIHAQGEASSSRSGRSLSTNHNGVPEINGLASHRRASPRPSLSTSRSHSSTSLHPGSASYIPPMEDNGEREPILNARLVTLPGVRRIKSRRGRTRGRLGREDMKDELPDDMYTPKMDLQGNGVTIEATTTEEEEEYDNDPSDSTDAPDDPRPDVKPLSEGERAKMKRLSDEIDTALEAGFKIEDVGTISRGWGD
ncbi:hypothetical protein BD410DRAFT_825885 [Rickenella mellea]|uniref:Uncharacterized protein n=1 Tax=Rickenella mellea TaxID=50990 RepID=A0A4Y7QE94_9AGAM|nr:hypothetical protein BD410DRAFT_825885 [Rickenella mellea]